MLDSPALLGRRVAKTARARHVQAQVQGYPATAAWGTGYGACRGGAHLAHERPGAMVVDYTSPEALLGQTLWDQLVFLTLRRGVIITTDLPHALQLAWRSSTCSGRVWAAQHALTALQTEALTGEWSPAAGPVRNTISVQVQGDLLRPPRPA